MAGARLTSDWHEALSRINRLLIDARMGHHAEPIPIADMPDGLKQLAAAANSLAKDVDEMCMMVTALGKGKLDILPPPRTNMLAGGAKQLHANLLHLTWQTQQVAEGDYTQSIDFLGDFSVAFNQMTSQLKDREALLEHDARTDSLTGLSNRRHLSIEAERNWPLYRRLSLPVTVMMIDIDKFKIYNDTYGHQQGDVCLRDVGSCIRRVLGRRTDVVARYGGEEFIVLLPDAPEDTARENAEKLRMAIEALIIERLDGGPPTRITCSIGVSTGVPSAYCTLDKMVALADDSLYKAKNAGRNRINQCTFVPTDRNAK